MLRLKACVARPSPKIFFFMFMSFCLHVCMCATLHVCLVTEENIGFPGPGASDVCKSSCGLWETNLSPLEQKEVFFTAELFFSSPSRSY